MLKGYVIGTNTLTNGENQWVKNSSSSQDANARIQRCPEPSLNAFSPFKRKAWDQSQHHRGTAWERPFGPPLTLSVLYPPHIAFNSPRLYLSFTWRGLLQWPRTQGSGGSPQSQGKCKNSIWTAPKLRIEPGLRL